MEDQYVVSIGLQKCMMGPEEPKHALCVAKSWARLKTVPLGHQPRGMVPCSWTLPSLVLPYRTSQGMKLVFREVHDVLGPFSSETGM